MQKKKRDDFLNNDYILYKTISYDNLKKIFNVEDLSMKDKTKKISQQDITNKEYWYCMEQFENLDRIILPNEDEILNGKKKLDKQRMICASINFKDKDFNIYKTIPYSSLNMFLGIIYDLDNVDIRAMYAGNNNTNGYVDCYNCPSNRVYINLKDEKKTLKENLRKLEFHTLHKNKGLIQSKSNILTDNKEWNEVLICPKISKSTDKQLYGAIDVYEMPIKSLMLVVNDINDEEKIKKQLKNISVDKVINFQKDKSLNYLPVFDLQNRKISKYQLEKLKSLIEKPKNKVITNKNQKLTKKVNNDNKKINKKEFKYFAKNHNNTNATIYYGKDGKTRDLIF